MVRFYLQDQQFKHQIKGTFDPVLMTLIILLNVK